MSIPAVMMSDSKIYQFNITVKGLKPKIWRRIQVPEDYTFWDMHVAIQDAVLWEDYYNLRQFEVVNPRSKVRDIISLNTARQAKIKNYFIHPQDKGTYRYKFSCVHHKEYSHEIVLEKTLHAVVGVKYPRCIGGKNPSVPNFFEFDFRQTEFLDPEELWNSFIFYNPYSVFNNL